MVTKDYAYIYALADPRDDEIRYIGKTVQEPEVRLQGHLREAAANTTGLPYKNAWLKSLLALELIPELIIIEVVPKSEWELWERSWIFRFSQKGCKLTNMTMGGNSFVETTGGTRKRLSAETKRKISMTLLGRPSPLLGKHHSEEAKRKVSVANKGKKPRLGMKNASEQNKKIGEANRKALKGRKITDPEKLAKLRRASYIRWGKDLSELEDKNE